MITEHKGGKLTWIDADKPSGDEVRDLLLNHGFAPSLMGDLSTSGARDGVRTDGNSLKITLHFPIVKRTDIDHPHELKFILNKTALLSVRYEDMEAIHRFRKEFEVIGTIYKTKRQANSAHLLCALLAEFYKTLEAKLDYLETRMRDIEREIFSDREKEMVFSISDVSRKLIAFRQTVSSHTDELKAFAEPLEKTFGVKIAGLYAEILAAQQAVVRRTNGLFDTLDELQNTNLAMLSTKQNEIVKTLTIVAFVTFPLTLMASLFGMNTHFNPIVGLPGDFWIILAIMTGGVIALVGFFRYKHWF